MNHANGLMPVKRCLVTGANGFIGQSLCRSLKAQDIFVRAFVRKAAKPALVCDETVVGDLKELGSCELGAGLIKQQTALMQNIDTVFHLAGIAHATRKQSISKETYWRVNVEATEQLLRLACDAGVKRFIYFSSVKAIGEPTDAYGHSKKAAENSVLFFGKKYDIHVTILRPALVYGFGVKGNLAMMIKGIRQGWFPVLPETKNQRSLISVEDLIDATLCVANSSQANGKIYTITDGQCYSSRQLYDAMRKALGKPHPRCAVPHFIFQIFAKFGDALQSVLQRDLPFNSDVLEKLLGSAYYPCKDIQNELGWQPKYDFSQVVTRMC